jgi:hypothetical protein
MEKAHKKSKAVVESSDSDSSEVQISKKRDKKSKKEKKDKEHKKDKKEKKDKKSKKEEKVEEILKKHPRFSASADDSK